MANGDGKEKDADNLSAKAGKRLRLSVVDFNSGFAVPAGNDVDSALLDIFKTCRLDDYSLVNCVFFQGEDPNHDPKPPAFRGFAPRGNAANRVPYLTKLIPGLQSRGLLLADTNCWVSSSIIGESRECSLMEVDGQSTLGCLATQTRMVMIIMITK